MNLRIKTLCAISLNLIFFSQAAVCQLETKEPAKVWQFEPSIRYWYSEGKTSWNHNASRDDPTLGNPSSILIYQNLQGQSIEFFSLLTHQSGFFINGLLAAGFVSQGTLIDQDFLAGQVKFSDTTSTIKNGTLRYLQINLGHSLFNHSSPEHSNTVSLRQIGLFVGYFYWNEDIHAYGSRCNPDDLGRTYDGCPPIMPFSETVISNQIIWNAMQLGLNADITLTPRFTISGNIAVLPVAAMKDKDSHYMRDDLGYVPNVILSGTGYGWTSEGLISYSFNERIHLGIGVRYWQLTSGGTTTFHYPKEERSPTPLNNIRSNRYGAYVQVKTALP